MPQLNFFQNAGGVSTQTMAITNGSITVFPLNLYDSISWSILNLAIRFSSAASQTLTLSLGLYSLTGSTLTLVNNITGSISNSGVSSRGWFSLSSTSATSNLTPGTWWFGLLFSTAGGAGVQMKGNFAKNLSNAFPLGFIGGSITVSSNALPTSIATSDLNTTGSAAIINPLVILTA